MDRVKEHAVWIFVDNFAIAVLLVIGLTGMAFAASDVLENNVTQVATSVVAAASALANFVRPDRGPKAVRVVGALIQFLALNFNSYRLMNTKKGG